MPGRLERQCDDVDVLAGEHAAQVSERAGAVWKPERELGFYRHRGRLSEALQRRASPIAFGSVERGGIRRGGELGEKAVDRCRASLADRCAWSRHRWGEGASNAAPL